VGEASGPRDVLLSAAGSRPGDWHKLWRTRTPNGYHRGYGCSTMGCEIPGALVFGELVGLGTNARLLIIGGSLIMIAGAAAIGFAETPAAEEASWKRAMEHECSRYHLNSSSVAAVLRGEAAFGGAKLKRHWWEAVIVLTAIGIFVWLAQGAAHQQMVVSLPWMIVLGVISLVLLVVCGIALWRRTRFS
jgi:hypothetical protein